MSPTLIDRFQAGLQSMVRKVVWGMDIHPSARISPRAMIDRTWPKGIHIEAGCMICDEAVVLTHDFARGIYLDTRIGARSYLGPRAIVLPGLTIGQDCIIRPGALVTRDMPSGYEAVGNPAEIRPRSDAAATIR